MWIFAGVMHRGQLLKKKMDAAGINKAEFSRRFGFKSNKSLYNSFRNPNVTTDLFIFAIKNYSLDFSRELPELRKETIDQMNDDMIGNTKMVPLELHLDVMKKYTNQLEVNQNLLEENLELYRKLGQKKKNSSKANHG